MPFPYVDYSRYIKLGGAIGVVVVFKIVYYSGFIHIIIMQWQIV
jgi:hypothetical protein